MNIPVSIKRRECTPHSLGFHLYVDAQDYDNAEVTEEEPPVYLQLEGASLPRRVVQAGERITIALSQDTARALGLLPRVLSGQSTGSAGRPVARLLTAGGAA